MARPKKKLEEFLGDSYDRRSLVIQVVWMLVFCGVER